jgi:hypothetical protein
MVRLASTTLLVFGKTTAPASMNLASSAPPGTAPPVQLAASYQLVSVPLAPFQKIVAALVVVICNRPVMAQKQTVDFKTLVNMDKRFEVIGWVGK